MKLWAIFRFEFAYQVSRIATWLYFAVLLAFAFFMNLLSSTNDGVYANAPYYIAGLIIAGGFFWLVMGAGIAGEAAARDVQTRMHPLTYTTPVTRFTYLGGRFMAAFGVNALLLLALPLGLLLSFYLPGMEEEALGPFRPSAYLSVYFFISLPLVFVATALQFTFAALSRQVMTSFIASLLLAFFALIVPTAAAQLFGNWDLEKLLDPVGIVGIVRSELETWAPAEKNIRLITLEGMFLLNRVLWAGVGVGALLFVYLRFSYAHPATSSWWSRFKRQPQDQAEMFTQKAIIGSTAISVPQVERRFGFATYFQQVRRIAWASFGRMARQPIGLTLVGAIALVSAVFGYQIMTQFGIPLIPTTGQVLAYFAAPVGSISTPWIIIPLLIMYFSGQLVWQERDAGLHDMADAVPVPEWVLFTGKFLGLALLVVTWMALLLAGGIGMQVSLGYDNFQIGLYLKPLFGLQLIDYLLFALLALVVHVVVNQKYIGYLVMLVVFVFIAFPSKFGVEHPLLIFGADSGWGYSDMRGFGATVGPWLWFKLYWIAWALLLAVAARLLWARGREQQLRHRLQLAQRRFTSATTSVTIIASGLLLTLGSFIFYNTNVQNEYLTSSDMSERKAEYERRYSKYLNTPHPQVSGTKLHVDIYPDQQQVEIRAAYTLVNKHTVPIDSIHIGSMSGIAFSEINFSRPAANVMEDKELSHYIYALGQALQPGDSLQLNFVVHYQQHGFSNNGASALVVKNGTYFTNYDMLPAIGYQHYREINDAVLRKKYKLAARPAIPSLYDPEARKRSIRAEQNTFEATIGTAEDEIAVAPGRLHRTWEEGDRRYFHFKTDAPIRGEFVILSGNYAVQERKWQDVAIRIYYHPDHALNIDRMRRSIAASLAHYTEQFGPYPYGHITVVERAGAGGGASADASLIHYGEQYALMNPDDSPSGFDLPYYILAHEVAHQWWGGAGLAPANVEGAGLLVEGLAVYSGMQVLEKNYGNGHLRQYLGFLHSFYEMPRSLATPALIRANEAFLYYRKGGLAMYAMSKYLGKDKVNGALRQLLQKHNSGELPQPTTLDLYAELHAVTPDSLEYLLHDLFKANTYWLLKTEQFAVEQTKADNWQVTLQVQAHKVVIDSAGIDHEVPMKDWLEIGIYEEGKGPDEPLYLRKHRIRSGSQTIKITVPRKPDRGGIDPNQLMIDLKLNDNMKQLDG